MISFKRVVFTCFVGSIFYLSLLSYSSASSQGVINFVGTILESTCQIDNESLNININIGSVTKSEIETYGMNSKATFFDVKLINCPETEGIQLLIDGDTDGDGYLNVTGGAKGVKVAFGDRNNGKAVPIGQNNITPLVANENGDITFNLGAYYVAYMGADSVISGDANATATFEVVYP